MYRHLYHNLIEWLDTDGAKPLLVLGARQVGKTYLIEHFLHEKCADFITINLERQEEYVSVFEDSLDPDVIIRGIEQLSAHKITPGTVIFLDEIQVSERAITSLKYFCESRNDIRVIGAGSLLGVKINRFEGAFPVGKVKMLNMYPMNFEEFLIALGEEALRDGIYDSYQTHQAMPDGIHKKALSKYHDYLMVGGMPEMVKNYIEVGKNLNDVDFAILSDLQVAYQADMTKYTFSGAESMKIISTYKSVPRQLSNENPKFKYKEIRPNANKRDFATSLDWLIASGLVYPVTKVSRPDTPLDAYQEENYVKIYMSDVGILTNMCSLKLSDLSSDTHNIYKGAVIENYVMQQLKAIGRDLYYYKPDDSMEIDALVRWQDDIIPVEIKAGRKRRSTSLKNYITRFEPPIAIRISEQNFGEINGLISVPLYAAWCIE